MRADPRLPGRALQGRQCARRDPGLRQGIKDYTNWPTIPQLYIKGEFVGGCDIIREMFQSGELATHLTEAGLPTKQPAES